MAQVGIMVEGQEGLTWDRWRRLCQEVERLGFASLRRSDHLMSVLADDGRDALDCWTSLALAATWTSRVEFGPMVSPISWHTPAVLAREAAALDILSAGRLVLGIGAGWFALQHERFGVALPPLKQRMDNYESGIQAILRTWQLTSPKPLRGERVPILLGGKGGEKRGLAIVAKYADEWNLTDADPDIYQHKMGVFLQHCGAVGRDPNTVRRSTLHGYLIGANDNEVLERAAMLRDVMPSLKDLQPREVLRSVEKQWFVGTPEQIVAQMKRFIELGVQLFMLVHWLQDDTAALELLATVQSQIA